MYKKETEVPDGVEVEIDGYKVTVSGENGKITRTFRHIYGVDIEKNGNVVTVSSESEKRRKKAIVGSILAHIKNMITGVTEGFTAELKVIYSHFPVTVKVDDKKNEVIIQNFLGEKEPRKSDIMGETTKIEVKGSDIIVKGPNIEAVGQTAANMERATNIKDHDRRIFQDGIFIVKKPKGEV